MIKMMFFFPDFRRINSIISSVRLISDLET